MSYGGGRRDTPHPARHSTPSTLGSSEDLCRGLLEGGVPGAITQAVGSMIFFPLVLPPESVSLMLCGLEDPPGCWGLNRASVWPLLWSLCTSTSCADAHHRGQMGLWTAAMLGPSAALTLFLRLVEIQSRTLWS